MLYTNKLGLNGGRNHAKQPPPPIIPLLRAIEKIIKMPFSLLWPLLSFFSVDRHFKCYSFGPACNSQRKNSTLLSEDQLELCQNRKLISTSAFYFSFVLKNNISKYNTGRRLAKYKTKLLTGNFFLLSNRPDWASLIDFQLYIFFFFYITFAFQDSAKDAGFLKLCYCWAMQLHQRWTQREKCGGGNNL